MHPRLSSIQKNCCIFAFCFLLLGSSFACTSETVAASEASPLAAPTQFTEPPLLEDTEFYLEPDPPTYNELLAELQEAPTTSGFVGLGGYALSTEEVLALDGAINAISSRGYHVGALFLDINTGYGVAYNLDEEFYSASSIKSVYVASVAASSPDIVELESSTIYSTLAYSSEDAYFSFRADYGHEPMVQWCRDAGVDDSVGINWFPTISTRTFAQLWLRTFDYFNSGSPEVPELLPHYQFTYNSPLSNTLSGSSTVFSKAGWIGEDGYFAAVDAGIVVSSGTDRNNEVRDYPYIVVIMSDVPGDTTMLAPLILTLDEIQGSLHQE